MANKRLRYADLFWIFMTGSILGFLIEGIWCILRKGAWENHAATVWGPLCLVYGIGAAVLYIMGMRSRTWRPMQQFWLCALAGTVVEYLTSLFQEMVFGSRSWDYSSHIIHLNGRVSLRMAMMWGLLGMMFIRLILPALQRMLLRMQGSGWHAACTVLSCWMVINLLLTGAALMRWAERQQGEAPGNCVEQALDARFDDTRMEALFCNMTFQ